MQYILTEEEYEKFRHQSVMYAAEVNKLAQAKVEVIEKRFRDSMQKILDKHCYGHSGSMYVAPELRNFTDAVIVALKDLRSAKESSDS